MPQLHQLLEDGVAEDTAHVLRLVAQERGLGLVEVHVEQGSLTGAAGLGGHPHAVGVLEAVGHHVALVAGHLPLRARGGVQHQHTALALHTLADAQHAQRVLAGGVRALIAAHAWQREGRREARLPCSPHAAAPQLHPGPPSVLHSPVSLVPAERAPPGVARTGLGSLPFSDCLNSPPLTL